MKNYFFMTSVLLILASCKKEQPQLSENHNCDCIEKVNAEFKFELDITTLSKGIYLVKVSTFGESKTKQLIIQ